MKKFKLDNLAVKSFVTKELSDNGRNIKGGQYEESEIFCNPNISLPPQVTQCDCVASQACPTRTPLACEL